MKPENNPINVEPQMRLRLRIGAGGVLDMPPVPRNGADPVRWAWPGGGARTYGELVRLCRDRGWPRPELLSARIVRRAETEEETHGK